MLGGSLLWCKPSIHYFLSRKINLWELSFHLFSLIKEFSSFQLWDPNPHFLAPYKLYLTLSSTHCSWTLSPHTKIKSPSYVLKPHLLEVYGKSFLPLRTLCLNLFLSSNLGQSSHLSSQPLTSLMSLILIQAWIFDMNIFSMNKFIDNKIKF